MPSSRRVMRRFPANVVVNQNNVEALTGFTSQQFADAASASVGTPAGLFSYDPFGNLTIGGKAFPSSGIPITVDPNFRTPYTKWVPRRASARTVLRHGDPARLFP